MPTHRRYTAKERAKAVGIATVDGVTIAAEQTGIPKQTIDYWLDKPEFGPLRTTAHEMVVDQFWVGIQVGIEAVVAGLRGDAPLKEKASALGVIYDRHALMTGMATSRSESRDLTGTLPDADLIAAVQEADAIASGRRAAPEDPIPSEG